MSSADLKIIEGNIYSGSNNHIIGTKNLIVGENNSIGYKGYKVLSCTKTISAESDMPCVNLSIDITNGPIDDRVSYGMKYSIIAQNSFIDVGTVLSVNID